MTAANPWHDYILSKAKEAREASHRLAALGTGVKDAALDSMARALVERGEALIKANAEDLSGAKERGLT